MKIVFMRNAGWLVASLCLVLACGDDDGGGGVADAGSDVDGASVDAEVGEPDAGIDCPAPAADSIGGSCPTLGAQASCDSETGAGDGFCLDEGVPNTSWPGEGYCLPIGGGTCPNCPAGTFCATILQPGSPATTACMPECCEGGATCGPNLICSSLLFGEDLGGTACVPGTLGASDGDPCVDFGDCDKNSICRNDQFLFPDGMCAVTNCTVFDDTTCNGGRCVDFDGPSGRAPLCVDDCELDSDCRESQGYVCFDGSAQNLGKFCRHPEVGDPCASADDCGGTPWVCKTAPEGFPGGYCAIEGCTTAGDCPVRSFCDTNETPTLCTQQCTEGDLAGVCRAGYTCNRVELGEPGPVGDRFGCQPE